MFQSLVLVCSTFYLGCPSHRTSCDTQLVTTSDLPRNGAACGQRGAVQLAFQGARGRAGTVLVGQHEPLPC